jgi:hypothetical protein
LHGFQDRDILWFNKHYFYIEREILIWLTPKWCDQYIQNPTHLSNLLSFLVEYGIRDLYWLLIVLVALNLPGHVWANEFLTLSINITVGSLKIFDSNEIYLKRHINDDFWLIDSVKSSILTMHKQLSLFYLVFGVFSWN